jgi:tellurite resistance protein TehA-like permease
LRGVRPEALDLWLLSLPVWAVLIYFSFGLYAFRNSAHLADVIDGGWLLAIVATQSLAILGTLIAPSTGGFSRPIFVLVYMLWGLGIGLYAVYVTLLFYRLFYVEVRPDELTPLLWVVMGAAAIGTNAGSTLLLADSSMPSLIATRPFVEGVTLILWAWAVWWIPLLIFLAFGNTLFTASPSPIRRCFGASSSPSACLRRVSKTCEVGHRTRRRSPLAVMTI